MNSEKRPQNQLVELSKNCSPLISSTPLASQAIHSSRRGVARDPRKFVSEPSNFSTPAQKISNLAVWNSFIFPRSHAPCNDLSDLDSRVFRTFEAETGAVR